MTVTGTEEVIVRAWWAVFRGGLAGVREALATTAAGAVLGFLGIVGLCRGPGHMQWSWALGLGGGAALLIGGVGVAIVLVLVLAQAVRAWWEVRVRGR